MVRDVDVRFSRPGPIQKIDSAPALPSTRHFAGFGSLQLWDLGLDGWVAVIPRVTPAIVGIPVISIWTRHQKFGDEAPQVAK